MTWAMTTRKIGLAFLIGGLFVIWVSTIEPYWIALHSDVGTRIYTSDFKGSFFSPFAIFLGLMLLGGGKKVVETIEGELRTGRNVWAELAMVSLIAGGLNTWWFRYQMIELGYRNDGQAHMLKHDFPVYANDAEAMAAIKAMPRLRQVKREPIRLSKEAWAAMSPEMRKSFSEFKPLQTEEGKR